MFLSEQPDQCLSLPRLLFSCTIFAQYKISHIKRKHVYGTVNNKDTDQPVYLLYVYAKTKLQISCEVIPQLISAVFSLQSFYFLNAKFQAYSQLTAWFVSNLAGNPADRFSHELAHAPTCT